MLYLSPFLLSILLPVEEAGGSRGSACNSQSVREQICQLPVVAPHPRRPEIKPAGCELNEKSEQGSVWRGVMRSEPAAVEWKHIQFSGFPHWFPPLCLVLVFWASWRLVLLCGHLFLLAACSIVACSLVLISS